MTQHEREAPIERSPTVMEETLDLFINIVDSISYREEFLAIMGKRTVCESRRNEGGLVRST